MDLIITIQPVVTKDLPFSPRLTPYNFLSRFKFSTLTTRQPMVEFYLLTFPRFPLRKKEHKSYFSKNRTHDFRTSRCAAYLLDHSGGTDSSDVWEFMAPFFLCWMLFRMCMVRCGRLAVFMWLCKLQTIEDHFLYEYHAMSCHGCKY